ncbi:putative basic amino acid antiporter YfcC [Crassaminicella profunda]|uniref:putative basic amino acid antiporter YfcC n=1 Tax=Crassaminicella profunda TaxID=1286698 RepID=UPI001CA6C815|nr:putative basic amino acid antiporter YfcC [Crassaminicella profunda]QZY54770.1 putative basic amino acid antiporter YfcC [Crassaminicella profunda]
MAAENKKNQKNKNRTWQMPDTYVIIFFVVLFAALLTYLIPVGQFDTKDITYVYKGVEKSRTVPIPESFRILTDDAGETVKNGIKWFEPGGGVGVVNYTFEGMVSGSKWGSAVGVIAFILVIGGAFGIILKTGAVEAGMLQMIKKTKGAESAIIPILFVLFSIGGAVFGMGEEAIPFAMILVPILIAMGYDAITGIMITYTATQIGFATSWMNPFSVAIAQGVSGVPVMSGAGFRFFMWVFFTALGVVYTWRYAKKIKKNPTLSLSYESDAYYRDDLKSKENIEVKFEFGHKLVLLTVFLGMIWVIYGVMKYEYYLPEIATQFFVMGIVSGIIAIIFKLNDMRVNDIASSFRDGAKDLLGAALVVGMAKGIVLVLGGSDPTTPTVLNTVLHAIGNAIGSLPATISAWFMFVFQSVFNFFVVSGSGQAALTMPLMAPLADLVGVTRQVAVLAFQLGDGFTNLIVPTSGCLMGMLAVARLDWSKWAKFQIKFQGILFILASIFMIGAVMIGFN